MRGTKPRPFVFVLMPFAPEYDDVYKLGIKPACENAGAYAERVDEQIFAESILERVYNQISKADLIVADLSGRNPNVFYETGYAHCLGKPAILLTRDANDIPFDLKHYFHIIYQGRISDLKEELSKRIDWMLRNPKPTADDQPLSVQTFVSGLQLSENAIITADLIYDSGHGRSGRKRAFVEFESESYDSESAGEFYFSLHLNLDIHNPIGARIQSAKFQLGLVAPSIFDSVTVKNMISKVISAGMIPLPDDHSLILPAVDYILLPGAWESITIKLMGTIKADCKYQFELRLFADVGTQVVPFIVHVKMEQKTLEAARRNYIPA